MRFVFFFLLVAVPCRSCLVAVVVCRVTVSCMYLFAEGTIKKKVEPERERERKAFSVYCAVSQTLKSEVP